MSEVDKLTASIVSKVKTLVEQNNSLKEKYNELLSEHVKCNKIIEDQSKELEKLKNSNRNLIVTELVKQAEGKSEVKWKIEEMMREIDKSIGLLNR
ncbi:MAG: hypothetical protein K9G76_09675 [Bacteroidales bacterium]|nr:hypothetical protein [Bacteroidales bacterium]MCF8403967.1 hypothetical protein [Bacteroidales bacterium]